MEDLGLAGRFGGRFGPGGRFGACGKFWWKIWPWWKVRVGVVGVSADGMGGGDSPSTILKLLF